MVLNSSDQDLEVTQKAYATLTNLKAEINCQLEACLRLLALDVRKRAALKGTFQSSAPAVLSQPASAASGTQTSSDSVLFRKLREASRALKSRTHELAARQRLWERMPSPTGSQAGERAPSLLSPRRMDIDAAGEPCWPPRSPASINSPSTRGTLASRQVGGGAFSPRSMPHRAAATAAQGDACTQAAGPKDASDLETALCIHKAGSSRMSSVQSSSGTHVGACGAAAPLRPAPARSPPVPPRPASARRHVASPAQPCRPPRPSPRLDRPQSALAAHAPTLSATHTSCGARTDAIPGDDASTSAHDGVPSVCAARFASELCENHASVDVATAKDSNEACWHLQGVSVSSASRPSRSPAAPRCASASERWELDVRDGVGREHCNAPMLLEEWLRSLEATRSAHDDGVWALHHGLALSDESGSAAWLPSACAPEQRHPGVQGTGAHDNANTRALFGLLPLLLKDCEEKSRAKPRASVAATETPAGAVEPEAADEAVAARMQGLLLLLSSPGAHDSAQEIASKVRASLPLWLPQSDASCLLWVPPGQRSLLPAEDGGSRGLGAFASPIAAGSVHAELFGRRHADSGEAHVAEASHGIAGESLRSGRASFVRDAAAHPLFDAGVDAGVTRGGGLLSVPLLDAAGDAVGVWQLSFGAHAALKQADVALMDVAAHWLRAQLYSSRERAGASAHALLSPMRAQLMHAATLSATEGSNADADTADASQGVPWLLRAARAASVRGGEEAGRLPILLLPLLTAYLPAVASATCWRVEANELVEIFSCTREEVEDTRGTETGPGQLSLPSVPIRASISALHHPAVASAVTNAAQLAQLPSQRPEAGRAVASPLQFTLCLPVSIEKDSQGAGLADAALDAAQCQCASGLSPMQPTSTLRSEAHFGADAASPARRIGDGDAPPHPRRFVLQLTSRAGVVLGGATCFAASELVALFCSLRTLLAACTAAQPLSQLSSPPRALARAESAALRAARRTQSPVGASAKLRSERAVGLNRSKSRISAQQRRVQVVMNSVVSELSEEEQRYAGRVLAEVSFSLLQARTALHVAIAAGAACRRACGAVRAGCWEWRATEGVLTRIGEESGACTLRPVRRGCGGATLLGELVLEGATVLLPDVRRQAGVLLEEPELMLEGGAPCTRAQRRAALTWKGLCLRVRRCVAERPRVSLAAADGRAPLHSFLASPLHAADGDVIGALLLVNKRSANAQDAASFNQACPSQTATSEPRESARILGLLTCYTHAQPSPLQGRATCVRKGLKMDAMVLQSIAASVAVALSNLRIAQTEHAASSLQRS